MDEKRGILAFTQNLVRKCGAGALFVVERRHLAQAGIHQKSKRQRQVGFTREIADGLRPPIFLQDEIVLGERVDDIAVFVAYRRQNIHDPYVRGNKNTGTCCPASGAASANAKISAMGDCENRMDTDISKLLIRKEPL